MAKQKKWKGFLFGTVVLIIHLDVLVSVNKPPQFCHLTMEKKNKNCLPSIVKG